MDKEKVKTEVKAIKSEMKDLSMMLSVAVQNKELSDDDFDLFLSKWMRKYQSANMKLCGMN